MGYYINSTVTIKAPNKTISDLIYEEIKTNIMKNYNDFTSDDLYINDAEDIVFRTICYEDYEELLVKYSDIFKNQVFQSTYYCPDAAGISIQELEYENGHVTVVREIEETYF